MLQNGFIDPRAGTASPAPPVKRWPPL